MTRPSFSHVLNQSGLFVPSMPGQTVSGADKHQYFYRVKNLIAFLQQRWGQAEVVTYPPSGGGTLAGKKGVILFEISGWSDAEGHAKDERTTSPQAGIRTYAQNYKDMVLADCIAIAYKNEPTVVMDAGSSASALRDWTYYDWEKNPYDVVTSLVNRYLARDYFNPLVESEIKNVRFDLLKCMDLYHSKELDALVKRVVINPRRSYRQDNPLPARSK
jgi:hypothetical protein